MTTVLINITTIFILNMQTYIDTRILLCGNRKLTCFSKKRKSGAYFRGFERKNKDVEMLLSKGRKIFFLMSLSRVLGFLVPGNPPPSKLVNKI